MEEKPECKRRTRVSEAETRDPQASRRPGVGQRGGRGGRGGVRDAVRAEDE